MQTIEIMTFIGERDVQNKGFPSYRQIIKDNPTEFVVTL
jgi:hypothetical protein